MVGAFTAPNSRACATNGPQRSVSDLPGQNAAHQRANHTSNEPMTQTSYAGSCAARMRCVCGSRKPLGQASDPEVIMGFGVKKLGASARCLGFASQRREHEATEVSGCLPLLTHALRSHSHGPRSPLAVRQRTRMRLRRSHDTITAARHRKPTVTAFFTAGRLSGGIQLFRWSFAVRFACSSGPPTKRCRAAEAPLVCWKLPYRSCADDKFVMRSF